MTTSARNAPRRLGALCVAVALLALSLPARSETIVSGEQFRLRVGGELRNLAAISHLTTERRASSVYDRPDIHSRAFEELRLMAWLTATPFLRFELAYQHQLAIGSASAERSLALTDRPPPPQRFVDLEWSVYEGEGLAWTHLFDRANLTLVLPVGWGFYLTLGRAAVSWGYGNVFRPADRFAPLRPIEVYREHAPGLDVVELRLPLGQLTEFRAVVVPAEEAEGLVALGRFEANLDAVDLAATVGDDRNQALFGLGVRADMGFVELTGVGQYVYAPDGEDYGRALLGVRVGVPILRSTGVFEVFYDGSGSASPSGYDALWASAEWLQSVRTTVGRFYAAIGIESRPVPLLEVGMRSIVAMEDESALIQLRVGIAVSQEAWVGLGAIFAIGAVERDNRAASEFGIAPNLYTLDFRLYF